MPLQQRKMYDVQTAGYLPEGSSTNQMVVRLKKEDFLESAVESSKIRHASNDRNNWFAYLSTQVTQSTISSEAYQVLSFKLPKTEFDARATNRPIAVAQQWEGIVSAIGDEDFTARLHDITNPANAAEEADFLIEDLNEYNMPLLKEGAVFRWIIGYRGGKTGTRSRVSQITFRQLPAWTESELAEADLKAHDLVTEIDWG